MPRINIRFADLGSLESAPKRTGFSDAKGDQDGSYVIHDNDDMDSVNAKGDPSSHFSVGFFFSSSSSTENVHDILKENVKL